MGELDGAAALAGLLHGQRSFDRQQCFLGPVLLLRRTRRKQLLTESTPAMDWSERGEPAASGDAEAPPDGNNRVGLFLFDEAKLRPLMDKRAASLDTTSCRPGR